MKAESVIDEAVAVAARCPSKMERRLGAVDHGKKWKHAYTRIVRAVFRYVGHRSVLSGAASNLRVRRLFRDEPFSLYNALVVTNKEDRLLNRLGLDWKSKFNGVFLEEMYRRNFMQTFLKTRFNRFPRELIELNFQK